MLHHNIKQKSSTTIANVFLHSTNHFTKASGRAKKTTSKGNESIQYNSKKEPGYKLVVLINYIYDRKVGR